MLKASDESPRMFQSDFLDFFSRVPALVVPIIYLPVIGLFASFSVVEAGVLPTVALLAFGWLVWSLMEYWLHRTLFHWRPNFSWGEQFHFFLHGVHHKWHQDKYRLVMPPAASISVALVVYGLLTVLQTASSAIVDLSWMNGVFAGVVWGYLVYDMVHYYIHHFKPTSKWMLELRAHHNKHHHNKKFQEKKFGVSMLIWDHVFGTFE